MLIVFLYGSALVFKVWELSLRVGQVGSALKPHVCETSLKSI